MIAVIVIKRAARSQRGIDVENDEAENEEPAYRVESRDECFSVVSPSGRTIMDCRDEHSASHYGVLLTDAYRIGYRAGYKAGRQAN